MEKLLTVKEATVALNIKSIHTIYRWIKKGVIPAVQIGRSIRISSDDLQEFIVHRKTKCAKHMFDSGSPRRSLSFPAKRERRPEWVV